MHFAGIVAGRPQPSARGGPRGRLAGVGADCRDRDAGFTLVELMVALAIIAAAAGLLSATLWSGGTAWRRGDARAEGGETVAAAQALLRERIERLAPAAEAAAGTPPLPATATGFVFLAPPADAARDPAVAVTTLARSADGRLLLSAGRSVLPLLDGVATIGIAYGGAAAGDPVPRWRPRWLAAEPPGLVRIRIGFAAGDRRRWPDLLVRPAVTAAAGCRVDPEKGACA